MLRILSLSSMNRFNLDTAGSIDGEFETWKTYVPNCPAPFSLQCTAYDYYGCMNSTGIGVFQQDTIFTTGIVGTGLPGDPPNFGFGPVCGAVLPNRKVGIFYATNCYNGWQNRRVFLCEVPSMKVLAQLPLNSKGKILSTALLAVDERFAVFDSLWFQLDTLVVPSRHPFASPFAAISAKRIAIAWHDGWFKLFTPDGGVIDSINATNKRPTALAYSNRGTLVAGYNDGTVLVFDVPPAYVSAVSQNTAGSELYCWPNPTEGALSVTLPTEFTTTTSIAVFTVNGQIVGEVEVPGNTSTIDMSSMFGTYSPGVYLVVARCLNGNAFSKVVLLH